MFRINKQTTTEFRPDIEGLRAIAVLLVILYHFKAPFIRGGFIGVDIFFVISGFLISRIVSASIDSKQFSFVAFYKRRIKRLMPALVLVCVVTVLVFSFFLLPQDYIFFLRSIRELFLLKLNLFFAKEMLDYFAPDTASAPWLHGWTLSVEWQFYLLFPPLLVVLRRFVTVKKLVWIMVALTLLAFAYSMRSLSMKGNVYYYFFPRLFEFMVGAVLAFVSIRIRAKWSAGLQYFAVFGMVLLSLLYNNTTDFPGAAALGVSLFVGLFILSHNTNTLVCTRPMKVLGRLSYSAYLWHWPLVALAYNQNMRLTDTAWLPLTVLVFASAWVSYVLVEKPCRQSRQPFSLALVLFVILPLLIIIFGIDNVRKNQGYPQRLGAAAETAVRKIEHHRSENQKRCHDFKGDDMEACVITDHAGDKSALLVGDSHAGHFWQFVALLAKDADIKAYGLTASRCQAFATVQRPGVSGEDHCVDYNEKIKSLIRNNPYGYVFIGQRWGSYLHIPEMDNSDEAIYQRMIDRLQYAVDMITETQAVPVFLLPVAEDGRDKNLCFYQKLIRHQPVQECDMPDLRQTSKGLALLYKGFAAIQAANPDVIVIDPRLAQCRDGVCASSYKDAPLYSDRHHLNGYGAHVLAEAFLSQHANPLNR